MGRDNKKKPKAPIAATPAPSPEGKADKKSKPPLESVNTKQFQKDWDRLSKGAQRNMGELKKAMLLVIKNDGMPPEYQTHELKGELSGTMDCHVGGDFVLLYTVTMADSMWGQVSFVRVGTHTELFKN